MTRPTQIWPEDFAARYRREGWWRGETFPAFLRARAAEHPGRIAVVEGDTRLSYGELLAQAEGVAAGLAALGLEPGDRVVVQLPNVAGFFPVVFGLFIAGLVPVYALPAHRQTEIAHFLRKSGARGYVIADRAGGFDYRPLARAVRAEAPALDHIVVLGEAGEFIPFATLLQTPPRAFPEPDPASVAFLQISGGSTGLSKLIPRTHDDYIYSFRASAEICGLGADSTYLCALPVAHNFPMSSPGVFGALYAGSRVVMCPDPSPATAFPLI